MFCVSGYSQNKHIHIKAVYASSIFKKKKYVCWRTESHNHSVRQHIFSYVGVLNLIISAISYEFKFNEKIKRIVI